MFGITIPFVTFLGLSAPIVSAASWIRKSPSGFQLTASDGVYPIISALDAALPNQKFGDIIADTNHVCPNTPVVPRVDFLTDSYTWPNGASFDDRGTSAWFPQGITTSSDAYDNGLYEGYDVTLVSWHHTIKSDGKNKDGPKGARITFIDRSSPNNDRYRHVLLVMGYEDSSGKASFRTQELHAGGIMWYGNLLYVVDTRAGIRIYDMNHIYEVDDGAGSSDGIGRVGTKYQAYGYKYVMPQVRSYTPYSVPSSEVAIRFSWISLDRTTTPDSILVGEYSPEAEECSTNCRLIRFPINYETRLLTLSSPSGNPNVRVAVATEVVQHQRTKTQGGISIDGKFYLTQSGGNLITWNGNVNSQDVITTDFFPTLPQDLSYRKKQGDLWTLTEPVDARWVFGFNPKKV
ncbi:hypothetical protein B0J14DRAFT_608047 [Halenospora varia]|nr:hypothetical protein B0J14DRAFT_608047 [Halenospora varia]